MGRDQSNGTQSGPAAPRVAVVDPGHHRLRIDRFLRSVFPDLSRGEILRSIAAGAVAVDQVVVHKRDHYVRRGQQVSWTPRPEAPPAELTAEHLVHADSRLVIIAKPPGLNTMTASEVGSSPQRRLNTMTASEVGSSAVAAASVLFNQGRPLHLVHRLDRETSGVLLLARDPATAHELDLRFRRRAIHKTYLALVRGAVPDLEGDIDAPLTDLVSSRGRVTVSAQRGRPAQTRYRVLERRAGDTLVAFEPCTGRRHQLRAHAAHIGHPIVGDERYGGRSAVRMWLHAWWVRFELHGHPLAYCAPAPPELQPSTPDDAGTST